jgi:dihydrofolate reductase
MRNVIFGINITLDGRCGHEDMIADDELHAYYTDLLRTVDVILFGRKTYQLMEPYWPVVAKNQSETKAVNEFAQTIDSLNKIVFSKTLSRVDWKNTKLSRTNIEDEIPKLKQQPGKDIFIDGLTIASHLTQLGLIDEYRFAIHPVVAGKGPRLFEAAVLKERLQLQLVESKTFRSGVVALYFKKHLRS